MKKVQFDRESLDGWQQSDELIYETDFFMTDSIQPDIVLLNEKRNEKKVKKKNIYLPYLSHDHSQERRCVPETEPKGLVNGELKKRISKKSSEKRIPTLSADRSADSKIKLKGNAKSLMRIEKSKNIKLNYEKIKKDIEQKQKILKRQVTLLKLKGSNLLESLNKNQNESGRFIDPKEQSFDEIKGYKQKVEDGRYNWWKKFLQNKTVKKEKNTNLSMYTVKVTEEEKKEKEIIKKIKQKMLMKNESQQRLKNAKDSRRELAYYIDKGYKKTNHSSSKDVHKYAKVSFLVKNKIK